MTSKKPIEQVAANQDSLDSIRDAEAIIAAGKPGYSSAEEMFEAMGIEQP